MALRRFTTTLANVPNVAPDSDDPKGVPVDAIIFGGRTRDREPLIRAITDLAEGVYDGLTLGAEATFAAEGVAGLLRYAQCRCARSCPIPRAPTPRTG
jgi:phosphoenolpyruvate carboxykinase (GTP)